MSTQATKTTPLFAAELTPHRSLTPRGLRIVMVVTVLLAIIPSLIFFALGAWPVVGFMLLAVAAIAGALQLVVQREKRREQLTLWADQLEIVTTNTKGVRSLIRFDPKGVRLLIERDMNERSTRLSLRTSIGDTEIGSFLSQDDRATFAKAFGTALRKARGR